MENIRSIILDILQKRGMKIAVEGSKKIQIECERYMISVFNSY